MLQCLRGDFSQCQVFLMTPPQQQQHHWNAKWQGRVQSTTSRTTSTTTFLLQNKSIFQNYMMPKYVRWKSKPLPTLHRLPSACIEGGLGSPLHPQSFPGICSFPPYISKHMNGKALTGTTYHPFCKSHRELTPQAILLLPTWLSWNHCNWARTEIWIPSKLLSLLWTFQALLTTLHWNNPGIPLSFHCPYFFLPNQMSDMAHFRQTSMQNKLKNINLTSWFDFLHRKFSSYA